MKERRSILISGMKKRIAGIFALAVILALSVTAFAPSYDSACNNGSEYEFNDGWLYENDDGTRTPFSAFGRRLDDREIVLVHPHDEALNKADAIGFYNYHSAAEVYVGDHLIYSYGSLSELENGVLLGNYYSMVDIHGHHMLPEDIRVVFRNTQPQTVYGFRAGSGAALEMTMIREYIPSLITPVLTLLFLGMSLMTIVRGDNRDLITRKHGWLMTFAVLISLWEITDSQLLMDMNFRAGTVSLLSFELYMLLPIPLLMLIYHSCRQLRDADILMCIVVFLNDLVLNVLHFSGVCDFLRTLVSTHIIVGVTAALCLTQILMERERKKSRETLLLLVGYVAFMVCLLVQYLKFFTDPTQSNSQILQPGVLLFLSLQISDVFAAINGKIYQTVKKLETRMEFLRQTFKALIPDDVGRMMLENKSAQVNLGSMRTLTIIESDIRGFSEFIRNMSAEDAIDMLNHYLGVMTNVIRMHGGIVLEFVGDAIIAIFDEETTGLDHADKAIFAAVEMQLCMEEVWEWNRKKNYPLFEMGIGMTTGEAYVGYIGSETRREYDAIGSTINLVSRIESYSTGGQILISKASMERISKELVVLDTFTITPKGYAEGVELFLIGGIGEPYNLRCTDDTEVPVTFHRPVPVTYNLVAHNQYQEPAIPAMIVGASSNSAMLVTEGGLKLYDNIRINMNDHISCKVVSKSQKGYLVRCTSASKQFGGWENGEGGSE